MRKHNSTATENFNKLIQFRQATYGLLGNARDALFELSDAVIQMRHVQSFAELSCAPAFRRKWPSVYEALQDGRPNRIGLMELYLKHLPENERLILAGDHTAWERLYAETLSGRSYQHQPTPIPGRRPVTIGLGYSTLAVIPERHSSWALPLLHERIKDQKPVLKGGQQLRTVCKRLPVRPLTLWDSEYGCAVFLKETADIPADTIFRLRGNLSLEGPTKPYRGRGPYPKHGMKFNFKDPTTWWEPDQINETVDPEFGPIIVRIWKGLRFRQALDCRMDVAQIERPQAPGTRRKPRILWLGATGETLPENWWSYYTQRYPVDHWNRFAKGRLHWTLPFLATPEQCDHWSDLMPFITWELWLARPIVADKPLPWQKPQVRLSPGRVCMGLEAILSRIGTPTCVPKPRGISPGWPQGKPRKPRERFELIRSEQWKRIRERQRAKKLQKTA
ncbi:MAG: transposase [Chloroflexi bacterium]|nr:transposase [Chloroflexota bacterium]